MDGLSVLERDTIIWLQQVTWRNETAAAAIVAMPFLKTFELGDLQIMRGLADSARTDRLEILLTNPLFRGGITDDHVLPMAIGAGMAYSRADAEAINRMLTPGYTDIENMSSGTELSPNLKISIVRTGLPPQPWIASTTKDAVELAEEVMGLPLPVAHVVNVISDEHTRLGREGGHQGSSFNSPPRWYGEKDTREGQMLQGHIAHEVSHYYWRGWMEDWIAEGVARTFEHLYGVENGLEPTTYNNPRGSCEAHNLQMLVEWDVKPGTPEFRCNYYLGGELWKDLHSHLGIEKFGERMQKLYLIHRDELWPKRDRLLGIDEVRRVFANESEIVEKHWSGKLNAPENRPWDEGLRHSSHNLIQWDQHPTYDGEFVTFSGSLLGDAVLSSGTLEEANMDGYGNFHIYSVNGSEFTGNISSPCQNRAPYYSGDTTALDYQLEGRTFTVKFRFPDGIGNPSDYFVDVWGYQDETRTPVIWEGFERDRLGYARIHTGITPTSLPADTQTLLTATEETRCLLSNNPALYRQIQELPWVIDGVTGKEIESIDWLAQMARDNEPAASRVLDMPFLHTHEPEDAVALEGLYESDSNDKLNHILAQPVFRDGIDETEIPLAVFVGYIAKTGGSSEKLERLLTPGYANIETQARGTALSPHMKVSIVRTGTEHQPWIMDAAFDAVNLIERVYGLPLPYGHVVFGISHESNCGCTWGFAFDVPLEWDQPQDAFEAHQLQGHIVHELVHSYYVTWESWLHEGIARTFEKMYGVENGLDPESYKNWRGRCEDHDLQMFAEKAITPASPEWGLGCAYYLGGELFLELLDHLGVEEFGARLREIRLTYYHNPPAGRYVGIHEVRQVFADESEIVEKHWSGKLNAPENRR